MGGELLRQTTRSLRLSEVEQPYAVACHHVVLEFDKADPQATDAPLAPRGVLNTSALRVEGLAVSSLIASLVCGDIRRVTVGSLDYLGRYGLSAKLSQLKARGSIAFTDFGVESWASAPLAVDAKALG